MKDDCGEWKVERRKDYMKQARVLVISIFSLVSLMFLVACSSQQPVSSTICGDEFHVLGGLNNSIEFSTDEKWILANCESDNGESKQVRVFRVDGSTSWSISLDNFPWNTDDVDPLARLVGYHWMDDGSSVYLRPICCHDSFNHGYIANVYGLYLLNLQTGEFSIVLSGENNNASPFSVSISPDGKYLVYVDLSNTPNILHIIDFQTKETRLVELSSDYVDTGVFVWTPDNGRLIFVAILDRWERSSLYSLEMDTLIVRAIIENDERLLFPGTKWDYQGKWGYWKDENTLFLAEFGGDKDWAINIQTGVLVEDNSWDGSP